MSDRGPRPTSTEWQRHGRPSPGEAGEASRTKDTVRPLIPGPPARGRGGDRRMAEERKRRILVVEERGADRDGPRAHRAVRRLRGRRPGRTGRGGAAARG